MNKLLSSLKKMDIKVNMDVKTPKLSLHNITIALLIAFIIFEQDIPLTIARVVDNPFGQIAVFAVAVYLFTLNRILGAVALVAAYELIRRSQKKTGRKMALKFLPTEDKKYKELTVLNQFPVTLEEEVVSNMVPFVENSSLGESSFKPHLTELHQASNL